MCVVGKQWQVSFALQNFAFEAILDFVFLLSFEQGAQTSFHHDVHAICGLICNEVYCYLFN